MARKQAPAALVRPSVPDALGGTAGLREISLRLAGIGEPEHARAVRLAFDAACQALTATKKQRLVVNTGLNTSEVREFEDEDHAMRLRAAEMMVDIFGLKPSRAASITNNGPVKIEVSFQRRPQRAEIIDVQ